jgi:hypothetical protein
VRGRAMSGRRVKPAIDRSGASASASWQSRPVTGLAASVVGLPTLLPAEEWHAVVADVMVG